MEKTINTTNTLKKVFRPYVLDGAIGSYLEICYPQYRNDSIWMTKLNSEDSNLLFTLHEEYIKSGADIITTNTFGSNPAVFDKNTKGRSDFYSTEHLQQSEQSAIECVKVCKKVIEQFNNSRSIMIAGSNPPAEYCYSSVRTLDLDQLRYNHENHINFLFKSGCDFILNETISHLDEIKIILDYCENNKINYAISLYFSKDLTILSGESIFDIIKFIDGNYNPIFIGINCVCYPIFKDFLNNCQENYFYNLKNKFGFYLNVGSLDHENINEKSITSSDFQNTLKEIFQNYNHLGLKDKLYLIGSCCMSDPSYTKEISTFLDSMQ